MKKVLIIFAALTFNLQLSTFNCLAQPNGGFEDWHSEFSFESPVGWQTINFLSLFPPNALSAFKATGVDKHSGNYALKLKTINIGNNPAPQTLPDTLGYAFTGKVSISPPSLKLGIPYTGRPEKLEFWAKCFPVGSEDAAGVAVALRKWNGTSPDTIGYGAIKIYTTQTYTFFQISINYRSTESPDTLILGFASSYHDSKARVGSTLFIDDVALTGWVGIDEPHICGTEKVKVFPNPAKENISILVQFEDAENVQVLDALGKLIGVYKIQNYLANVNTDGFPAGVYCYEIQDKKNKMLSNGKFNIVR